jgi:anti-sigma factor RsiW
MNITRNVVNDLLPVYLSGEASADTKTLVEEFLRQDPELARIVGEQSREFSAQTEWLRAEVAPSVDHQLQTLTRTRLLMERQKWSMALALMLTAFPLSFVFSGGHLTFLTVRDQPLLAIASWVGAVFLWVHYFIVRRQLRRSGL